MSYEIRLTFPVECENCKHTFYCARHERLSWGPYGTRLAVVCGTGKNMTYRGDMNREYAVCPKCGHVEHQFSAEARDQGEELEHEIPFVRPTE